MKFVCSFEVETTNIDYAVQLADETLRAHLLSLMETKLNLMCEDENHPGIKQMNQWIEEARQMMKTLTVKEKEV